MLYKYILCALFISTMVFSQQEKDFQKKFHTIISAEVFTGLTGGTFGASPVGYEFTFQKDKHIIQYRHTARWKFARHYYYKSHDTYPYEAYYTSDVITQAHIRDYALLYGKRLYMDSNKFFNFLGGVSYNHHKEKSRYWLLGYDSIDDYIGFPFELSIKWFSKERLGYGAGLKVFGNIAKSYYIGVGFNFGLAWHEKH